MAKPVYKHTPSVRPLVMIFGSYRGDGKGQLARISCYLRERGIRAFTVAEYTESWEENALKVSLHCIDECNIAIFVFFRAGTIGVTRHLEAIDQGPLIEFAYLCLCKKDYPTAVQVVFDSEFRMEYMSTLFYELVKAAPRLKNVDYLPVEQDSPDAVIEEIQKETLSFCTDEYIERGVW